MKSEVFHNSNEEGIIENVGICFIHATAWKFQVKVAGCETAHSHGGLYHTGMGTPPAPLSLSSTVSQISVVSVKLSYRQAFNSFHVVSNQWEVRVEEVVLGAFPVRKSHTRTLFHQGA